MTVQSLSLFSLLLLSAQLNYTPFLSLPSSTAFQLASNQLGAPFADAIACHCTSCITTNFTCQLDGEFESACYAYFEKVWDEDKRRNVVEHDYGCLSSNNTIAHLQCQAKLNLENGKHIQCCRGKDLCNSGITTPSEIQPDPEDVEPPFIKKIWSEVTKVDLVPVGIIFLFFIVTLLFFYCIYAAIMKTVKKLLRNQIDKKELQHNSSSFNLQPSLKIEYSDRLSVIKLNNEPYIHNSNTNSTPTTASWSDLHKDLPEESHAKTGPDLTSGVGDRMLMESTPAREVATGPMELVGQGRFGKVYRSIYHDEEVAVKAFSSMDEDAWRREEFIYCNLKLSHYNIVSHKVSELTCFNTVIPEYWMIMEYCPYGSLYDFLNNEKNKVTENQAAQILLSVISGLYHLHEDYGFGSTTRKPRIAHRDIKSKNILMRSPTVCCLADFGHAAVEVGPNCMDFGKYDHDLRIGTVRYMAPEILKPSASINIHYFGTFAKADVYQFGLVVWEVCQRTSHPPYRPKPSYCLPYGDQVPPDPKFEDMIKVVCERQIRPVIYDCWTRNPVLSRLADLMPECWRANPESRMDTLGVKTRLRILCDDIDNRRTFI